MAFTGSRRLNTSGKGRIQPGVSLQDAQKQQGVCPRVIGSRPEVFQRVEQGPHFPVIAEGKRNGRHEWAVPGWRAWECGTQAVVSGSGLGGSRVPEKSQGALQEQGTEEHSDGSLRMLIGQLSECRQTAAPGGGEGVCP